jgi:hypothetical protein
VELTEEAAALKQDNMQRQHIIIIMLPIKP